MIEFSEHHAAANALLAMHKRLFMGKEIKINWANVPLYPKNKVKTSKFVQMSDNIRYTFSVLCSILRPEYYNIFVGDIAPEIDQNILRAAFLPYGEIT